MHHLLKRQLKKIDTTVDEKFLKVVEQAYIDADEDRLLLERSLEITSHEMRALYQQIKKNAAEKVKETQNKYERLVNSLSNYYFFYSHDTNGIFTYVSDSITNILDYSIEEFLVHYDSYLTDDPINDIVSDMTDSAINGQEQKPYILSIFHKNGTVCYLEVTEFPIFGSDGKVIEIEGIARDITEQYKIQEKLEYASEHDPLTGLANRTNLYNQLEYIIANSKRNKKRFAVLFLDLDHFKNINDDLGHNIGDEILKEVTHRIKKNIRQDDVFSRIGGDEFIIVLTDVDTKYISLIATKIIKIVQKPFIIGKYKLTISASIGISTYPKDGQRIQTLLKNADKAMYKVKESGKNNFTYYRG